MKTWKQSGGVVWAVLLGGGLVGAVEAQVGGAAKDVVMERAIRMEVVVAAPVEKAWEAWTTREGIVSFFGADAKVELAVGGAFEVYFNMEAPEGSRGSEGCRVLSYVPREMLSFSWNAPLSMPNVRKERTQVVLLFERVGAARTRVRLVHHGWGVGEEWDRAFAYFTRAWGQVLESLEKRLGGEGAKEARKQFIYFTEPARATFLEDATEDEQAKVSEHFRYLEGLLAEGVLILAGRTDEAQPVGIVVFEAADLDTARGIMENDPAVKAGVFKGRVAPYGVALMRGR